jgi:hypothetical protein
MRSFAECSAKAYAFSSLLLAQVPCDVPSGEEVFLTYLIFFVAFHKE